MASNALTLPKRNAPAARPVPAHIAARIAERQAAGIKTSSGRLGGGGGDSINRISLLGNRFNQIVDGEKIAVSNAAQLDVVILGIQPSVGRQYFEGAYDPNAQKTAPVCYSHDGKKPAANVAKKQCTTCAACPMNEKGSATNGSSKGRACSFVQRLAVMVPGDETESVYALDAKAMSLFGEDTPKDGYYNLKNYGKFLEKQGVEPWETYTTIMFDPRSSVPKLLFVPGDWMDPDAMGIIMEKQETEVPKIMKAFGEDVDNAAAEEAPAPAQRTLQTAIDRNAATQAAPAAPARQAPRQAPQAQAQAPVQQAPAAPAQQAPRTRLGSGARPAPAPAPQEQVIEADPLDAAIDGATQAAAAAPARPRLGGARPPVQAAAKPTLGGGRAVKPVQTPTMADIDDGLSEYTA
jgi:hypothetical protein